MPRGYQLIFSCWYLLSSDAVKKVFHLVCSGSTSMSIETDGVFHNSCIEHCFFLVFKGVKDKKDSISYVYGAFLYCCAIMSIFDYFFSFDSLQKIISSNYSFVVDFFFPNFKFSILFALKKHYLSPLPVTAFTTTTLCPLFCLECSFPFTLMYALPHVFGVLPGSLQPSLRMSILIEETVKQQENRRWNNSNISLHR